MLIGYARTSTIDQRAGLEAQIRELKKIGVEKIFQEQVSSAGQRDELEKAISFIREGDILIVTRLDRLARSVRDLIQIVDQVHMKNSGLKILSMDLDTGTATGRLMLQILGAIAEFERALMLERQREGIEKAKRNGKYKGRKPTVRGKRELIVQMLSEGVGPTEVARKLSISRSSVYRIAEL